MQVYVVRNWPLRGRSCFVCWNIKRVSVWLLCNVHFVQNTRRTRLQMRPFVRSINNLLKLDVCGSRNQVEDDVEQVRASFLHSPKKSTVTASKELSMSKTTVWRVLHKHLVFKPYCIQMVQQLSDEDHLCLLDFCLQLQDLKSSDDHFLVKVQFSDEATFHVSSAVNWHNVRIWGSENPHGYVEHQCDSPKVHVFCAISSQKVYGPVFFPEETITGMT